MLVDIVVFDGLDEMDAWGPCEVLRSAESMGADISTRLVTRTPQELVTGAHGLRFVPDGTYVQGEADLLIVPGGGWIARSDIGAWGEVQRGDWLPLIAEAAETTRILAGVCSGSMLLAHAGVIGARRAATHHGCQTELAELGATVVHQRVVDDGDLVTAGGVTSGIDLALHLVRREISPELAERIAQRMEYPASGAASTP